LSVGNILLKSGIMTNKEKDIAIRFILLDLQTKSITMEQSLIEINQVFKSYHQSKLREELIEYVERDWIERSDDCFTQKAIESRVDEYLKTK